MDNYVKRGEIVVKMQ